MKGLRILAALALGCLLATPARAEERILAFDASINVSADGSLQVTETIRVRAEGKEIRRGIYRDFPLDYEDRRGMHYRVGFDLREVERDGAPEPHHTERLSNGIRIYVGSADRLIAHGEHTYRLRYRTTRQLGFFEEHDELYWNVTGNGWVFPIDHASARVVLPAEVARSDLMLAGWTGPQGSTAKAFTQRVLDGRRVEFETTAPLAPREGLTIAVGWPKGMVEPPGAADEARAWLEANATLAALLGTIAVVFVYYLIGWVRAGRDPPGGVIIPEYQPPKGLSPGAARYLARMGHDRTAFVAAVVNLAVKGYWTILENEDGFVLERTGKSVDKAPGEAAITAKLPGKRFRFEQSKHATISSAIDAHEQALKKNWNKEYFITNAGWFAGGVVLSIVGLLAAIALGVMYGNEFDVFIAMFGGVGSMIGAGMIAGLVKGLQAWRGLNWPKRIAMLLSNGIALGFLGFILAQLPFGDISPGVILLGLGAISVLGLNMLFYWLLKAPTKLGRKLLDRVDGYRLYLGVAEGDELELRDRPEKTPEEFQRNLPYAIALGVADRWAARFAAVLATAAAAGRSFDFDRPTGFASTLSSSLGSSIAAAATAPGSSSGFSGGGGGGSSGGGGGGGGGGGW